MRLPLLPAIVVAGSLCFGVVGCRPRPQGSPLVSHQESFAVRGKIVSVDPKGGSIVLDHGAVPGFMGAMAMQYKLKDPNIISEMHAGDMISAKILVQKDDAGFKDPKLDEIVVVGQAKPDYKPTVEYHQPVKGDAVPNFALTNQSAKTLHLDQFHGKVLLVTFIYTRCQMADFCPRMSRQFAEIDEQLAKNPKLYAGTHLLSISFDPEYDTPTVLKSYGSGYTGKYTKETFTHWDFAAPSVADLPKVAQWFSVGITPGDPGQLNHSLSTAVIDKNGKIAAWYPTGEWTPDEILSEVKALQS